MSACQLAAHIKNFFDNVGIKYVYYDIQHIPDGNNSKQHLSGLTNNYDKVPMVFFYGMFIGGYNETMKYLGVK